MALLGLEEYADIAAELDAGAPRDETLAAMNISLATYFESQQHWLPRIAAEFQRGRTKTFELYNARFLARRRAVAQRLQAADRASTHARRARALESDLAGLSMHELPQASAPVADVGARLTLTQYASFFAELAVQPDQDAAIRSRYGFDAASFERERAHWEAQFAANQALFAEYLAYFRHYRDWLMNARANAK